jgi:hypothetical protein
MYSAAAKLLVLRLGEVFDAPLTRLLILHEVRYGASMQQNAAPQYLPVLRLVRPSIRLTPGSDNRILEPFPYLFSLDKSLALKISFLIGLLETLVVRMNMVTRRFVNQRCMPLFRLFIPHHIPHLTIPRPSPLLL